ncbi:class IIb bacteriocin, lactobin A/cerein 7B family [Flavobacterium sp.]
MNLENLNLVELNAQEVQEIEGGFLPLLLICVVAFLLPSPNTPAY